MRSEAFLRDHATHRWRMEEIDDLVTGLLHDALRCDTPESVDFATAFAGFMAQQPLGSRNYPVFLRLLQLQNHWVADCLLGETEPEHFFDAVEPNRFILASCFNMLGTYRRGEVYPRTLLVIIGLLKRGYEHPHSGCRVYPLTVTDVNNLGKHLDENEGQSFPLNRTILHVLERIASYADSAGFQPTDRQVAEAAVQAANIRSEFLNDSRTFHEAIPTEMLRTGDYRTTEVAPSPAMRRAAPVGSNGRPHRSGGANPKLEPVAGARVGTAGP